MISSRTLTFAGLAVAFALAAGPLHTLGGPTAAATSAPAAAETVASLRTAALGDDYDKSMTALQQLAAAGPRAEQTLGEVVRQLLPRDATTIESEAAAITPQLPKLRTTEAELEPLRAQALAAIEVLTTDPQILAAARRNYARLSNTAARLTPVYSRQKQIIESLARRADVALVPQAKPPAPGDAERLARLAGQGLAMPAETAQKFLNGPLDPPADPARRRLWLYVVARRIETWNHLVEPAMNAAEIAHARRVNTYRELLGLLPYEWDARLVQSARRHSKEMIDLWYFSHYSPTQTERDPFGRMARAGYTVGSNENITMGSWSGDDAFWQFFNSPDHHRVWLDRDATAIGVGKWEFAWTQDLGTGSRLMTATADERAGATLVGAELKPQVTEQTRQHPRDLSTIKFYDESGQEVKQLPGIERKVSPRNGP